MSLYREGYRPPRLPKRFEAISLSASGEGQAGAILRRYGVPEAYGDPTEAVGYFDGDEDQILRAIVADYANGRRAELRINRGAYRMSLYTPERAA